MNRLKKIVLVFALISMAPHLCAYRKVIVHHRIPAPRVVVPHYEARYRYVSPSIPGILSAAAIAAILAAGGHFEYDPYYPYYRIVYYQ